MNDLKYAILRLLLTPVTLVGMMLAAILACIAGVVIGVLVR